MRRIASRHVAAISCLLFLLPLRAARRPRYGGSLRIETRAVFNKLDPSVTAGDVFTEARRQNILGQVFETLVRLDERGDPQPLLATAWVHDAAHKRWIFTPRDNVVFHDGARWSPPGGVVVDDDDGRPIDEILRSLADPRNAISAKSADGALVGTGPFRIAHWEPGASLTLEANDAYWGGRPYLDRVEIRLGRTEREQSLDFELGKTDVIELPVSEVRRDQQRGAKVASSAPVDLLALIVDSAPERIEQALSLAIDRNAIFNVLLQRSGTISGGMLPNWLTGYSFVFPTATDLARARQLAGSQKAPLSLGYDQQSPLTRLIAERIMLNAGEAGIVVRPAGTGAPNIRLVTLRFSSTDPAQALGQMAAGLGAPSKVPAGASSPDVYAAERDLIESRRVVPLFHLPAAYRLSPALHGWPARSGSTDQWALEDVWLEERGKP